MTRQDPDPLKTLRDEHEMVECVIDGLEAAALAFRTGILSDPVLLRELAWFLIEFADGRHHAKEEGILFPALEANGLSSQEGPTETMRREHVQGRALTMQLLALLPEGAADGPDWKEASEVAMSCVQLLRSHMEKENHCLFVIADQILSPIEKKRMAEAFIRIDEEWAAARGDGAGARVREILRIAQDCWEGEWKSVLAGCMAVRA